MNLFITGKLTRGPARRNPDHSAGGYSQWHPDARKVPWQDILANSTTSFSLKPKWSMASSYSFDRQVLLTVGLSVHRATLTPASRKRGRGWSFRFGTAPVWRFEERQTSR